MATKDWNGFKKSGDTYIPNDATARAGLQNKVDKVSGKGLSTNDYTNADKAVVTTAQDNIKANTKLIKDTVGWSGKNKLPNLLTNGTDSAGVTYTKNADGSVSMSASTISTNTDRAIYDTRDTGVVNFLKGESLVLYKGLEDTNVKMLINAYQDNSYVKTIVDLENGVVSQAFILDYVGYNRVRITVYIKSTADLSVPKTIYPMIHSANILDNTYEPYFGSTAFPRSEQAVLGAKNRIGILSSRLKAQNTTGTWTGNTYAKDGVTFECTVDSAGYVTNIRANGTASSGSAQIDYDLGYSVSNGRYKLNGAPVGGGSLQSANWFLGLYKTNASSGNNLAYDFGDGADVNLNFSEPLPNLYIRIGVSNGKTITNGDFKPMLSFDGGEYVPYAMTNKELTEDKVDKGFIQLTSSDDLNNLNENGKRYYWDNATPINYAGDKYCKMFVFTVGDFCHQVIIRSNNQIFMRQFNGTAWQSWYKFEGVIVS